MSRVGQIAVELQVSLELPIMMLGMYTHLQCSQTICRLPYMLMCTHAR
jgi:hypothetical protein